MGAGRPPLLTPERLEQVREAYALGLSEKEAAEACGVSESSWHSWKSQGRAAQEALDEKPVAKRSVAELRALLRELGGNPDRVKPGGRRRKASKADYVTAVEERVAPFLEFLERLQAARPEAKRNLLKTAHSLAAGGLVVTETKVVTKVLGIKVDGEDGAESAEPLGEPVVVETTTTTKETLPHWAAIRTLLERRWPDDLGPRKALDPPPPSNEKELERQREQDARAMLETVPAGPPAKDPDQMSREELEAELAAAGAPP